MLIENQTKSILIAINIFCSISLVAQHLSNQDRFDTEAFRFLKNTAEVLHEN